MRGYREHRVYRTVILVVVGRVRDSVLAITGGIATRIVSHETISTIKNLAHEKPCEGTVGIDRCSLDLVNLTTVRETIGFIGSVELVNVALLEVLLSTYLLVTSRGGLDLVEVSHPKQISKIMEIYYH